MDNMQINQQTPQMNPKSLLTAIVAAVAMLMLIFWMCSCRGCKKEAPVIITVPDQIGNKHQSKEDSLSYVIQSQQIQIDSLKKQLVKSRAKTTEAKKQVEQSIDNAIASAEQSNCDTVLNDLQNVKIEFQEYAYQTDRQMELQGAIIQTQDSVIIKVYRYADLQQTKFKELSTAYDELGQKLSKTEKALAKSERRRKGAKALNKTFIIGGVVAAVLLLK